MNRRMYTPVKVGRYNRLPRGGIFWRALGIVLALVILFLAISLYRNHSVP